MRNIYDEYLDFENEAFVEEVMDEEDIWYKMPEEETYE